MTQKSPFAGLQLAGFPLGDYQTNAFVVAPEGGQTCWIVDPGQRPAALIEHVKSLGLPPEAIVLTHAHHDHIAGIPEVLAVWLGTPIYLHDAEREWLANPELNLSAFAGGSPVSMAGPDRSLAEGDTLELGESRWNVLHTPGHSPGSVTLVCESAAGHTPSVILSGDVLFQGSVGRSDFPTSDPAALEASIRNKLYALPDDTVVLCGHGPETTIGIEKQSNPFVRA
ncbi:MAG: MBL fold metallo-hydrolase [Planctomycetota bacterium]